jgi:hypothetical protein
MTPNIHTIIRQHVSLEVRWPPLHADLFVVAQPS